MLYWLTLVTGALYLVWRLDSFNPAAPLFSGLFYAAEILAFLALALRLHVLRHGPGRLVAQPPPPPADWPDIDIFVPSYGEPVELVRRTLVAALRMEGRATVWLLDDGCREEMRKLAAQLQVRYLPRQARAGAKAGNLNHGLAHATGEFVAVFDADHAPEERFLTRLMGYFADTSVAMVQTPQDYFNLDSFQHGRAKAAPSLWHEQSLFHWAEQPARHRLNATTCCGCSMIVRRAALDAVEGFPVETVTEDMHLSVRLHKRGDRIVYHPEPLAFGIAPASAVEFLLQRRRWGEGNMQVCRAEGIPFARDLTRDQNLAYLMLGTTYLEAWLKLFGYCAPIVFLWTGIAPIRAPFDVFLLWFLPYLACGLLAFVEFGAGYAPLLAMERYTMARLMAGLVSSRGFFRKNLTFRVASKALRGNDTLTWLIPQILIAAVGAGGIVAAACRIAAGAWQPPLGLTCAVALLVLYNGLLAAGVLKNALRCRRLKSGAWQVPAPFPVRLGRHDSLINAVEISESTLVMESAAELESPCPVAVYLPEGPIHGTAFCIDSGTGSGANRQYWRLDWPNRGTMDKLIHGLTVGQWQRHLCGRGERRPTWLERLRLKPPVAAVLGGWAWGIWRVAGQPDSGRLACLHPNDMAVLFGGAQLRIGSLVKITLASGMREMRITGLDTDTGLAALSGQAFQVACGDKA